MVEIGKDQYVSGGYYLAHRSRRGAYMSPDLIPDEVLSASGCICEFFPDDWAIEWTSEQPEERLKSAAAFGIISADLRTVIRWATESFSKLFGWPNTFYTLHGAQEARAAVLPGNLDIVVFGLGLNRADAEDFLSAAKPPDQALGYAPQGETGVYQCVKSGESIAKGGEPVGFEILDSEAGLLTCSWLCNGLETVCAVNLGVRPNAYGFVPTYADGVRCAEFVSRDEIGAEPGLWLPWLVTIYS